MKRGLIICFVFLLVISGFIIVSAEETPFSKAVGEIQLIYDDNSGTIDSVILGNLQTWLTESGFKSSLIKNSEITNEAMKDKLTVFVYNKKAVVIWGETSNNNVQVEAGNIYLHLKEDSSIEKVCDLVSSNEHSGDDLKDYLCKEENESPKTTGEMQIQLVYDDNSDAMDSVILGNLQIWLKENNLESTILKNSDVTAAQIKAKITVFVYNKEAVVIYGEETNTNLQVKAGNIYSRLQEDSSVEKVCDLVSSNEFSGDDLRDYLCNKKLPEVTTEIQLVYDDDSETIDSVILGNLQNWLTEKGLKSTIIKKSDVDHSVMKNKITVFVYNKKVVVVYGEKVSTDLQVKAGNIYLHLKEDSSIEKVCDLVSSSEFSSDDLKDYLCDSETESELEVISPVDDPVQITESDKKYICSGCELEDNCYPFGYRKDGKFCSDTREFIEQKDKEILCENNFECRSNVCVSGECIDGGFLKKIMNWFKKLFGGE